MKRRTRVRVFGSAGALVGDEIVLVDGADADVALLDLTAFDDADALFAQRASLDGPSLVRAPGERIGEVLDRLGPDDELCLDTDPVALVVHRLVKLAGPRCPLTGLSMRATWTRELERALLRATDDRPVSVVVVDLDRFKSANDQFGHSKGDEILAALGQRLLTHFGSLPLVARVGGEEFGLLVAGDEAKASEIAERARAVVEAEALADVAMTVSVGAATAQERMAVANLMRDADHALYAAKARGRNRACHAAALVRKSVEEGKDAGLEGFEDFTHVIAERVAEVINRRGRRLFEQLKTQADVDALTQLYSRRYLDRRLPFEADQAEASDIPLTVALLDIDHFGQVNKEHGWPTGDRVLSELAEVVRRAIRATDWVARYGGEELCIVLTNTRLSEAAQVLERIRSAVESHALKSTQGAALSVTVSIGAAERSDTEQVPALVERASDRLLAAKRAGRNQICT